MNKLILKVEHLSLWLTKNQQSIQVLNDINFALSRYDYLGIAGESGAGKSMLVYSLTSLLPTHNVRLSGKIWLYQDDGTPLDLLALPVRQRYDLTSRYFSLILQDSINALNPYQTIYKQWHETLQLHRQLPPKEEQDYLLKQLATVGLPAKADLLQRYPAELSGGMRQRIAIALALEGPQKILIADEPTTALDTINQRKIINLILQLCQDRQLTLMYVTHDLGIIKEICTKTAFLKGGHIIEQGLTKDIFDHPQHPLTKKLLTATQQLWDPERMN